MAQYEIRILKPAEKELKQADKSVAKRVIDRVKWLAENYDNVKPLPLSGNLVGFYKLRIGDFRVIYEPVEGERVIIIHHIGHRKDIYKM